MWNFPVKTLFSGIFMGRVPMLSWIFSPWIPSTTTLTWNQWQKGIMLHSRWGTGILRTFKNKLRIHYWRGRRFCKSFRIQQVHNCHNLLNNKNYLESGALPRYTSTFDILGSLMQGFKTQKYSYSRMSFKFVKKNNDRTLNMSSWVGASGNIAIAMKLIHWLIIPKPKL